MKSTASVGNGVGNRDVFGVKALALPFLRGRVIDLEDAEVRERIAIREGVEAGAEDDELSDAAADGEGEFVFGVAGAGGHEGAHVAG